MDTKEILNILLIILIPVLLVAIAFVTYFLVTALKAITRLADSLENTTQTLTEKLQFRALTTVPIILLGILSRIFKRRG